jgi:hypothetical protein
MRRLDKNGQKTEWDPRSFYTPKSKNISNTPITDRTVTVAWDPRAQLVIRSFNIELQITRILFGWYFSLKLHTLGEERLFSVIRSPPLRGKRLRCNCEHRVLLYVQQRGTVLLKTSPHKRNEQTEKPIQAESSRLEEWKLVQVAQKNGSWTEPSGLLRSCICHFAPPSPDVTCAATSAQCLRDLYNLLEQLRFRLWSPSMDFKF